jgi:8-oxo-dGTP diphosphatase
MPATGPTVHVVAGALFDADGRVLLAQRPEGKHLAGGWEFPGGKVDPGETALQALKRELREELGIETHSARPLIAYEHPYPHRTVLLDLWHVTEYSGVPRPLEGQPLKWVATEALEKVGLLAADAPMVPAIREIVGR